MSGETSRQEALWAIGDPTRREILHLVADREVSATEVASFFELTRAAVSQHLSVLLAAELVTVRTEGPRRFYRANKDELQSLLRWLDGYWSTGLFQLQRAVEGSARKGRAKKKSR